VPPAERIATFDQDGTLWVEHPVYTQVVYCLDRVPMVVEAKPDLASVEPFKTVMSGNREAIAKLSMDDLMKILAATLTGMSVDDFEAEVKKWLVSARDPRWKRPFTKLTYSPMIELLKYMRASGYRTYFVTGGAKISCECTRTRFTVFHPNRWSEPPEAQPTDMTSMADLS
jgi:phosphoserine phosphatase